MLGFIRILTCVVWILINEAYGKMVVNIEDLNTVSSDDIEKEATLVETFQRETDCEGVMVEFNLLTSGLYQNNFLFRTM